MEPYEVRRMAQREEQAEEAMLRSFEEQQQQQLTSSLRDSNGGSFGSGGGGSNGGGSGGGGSESNNSARRLGVHESFRRMHALIDDKKPSSSELPPPHKKLRQAVNRVSMINRMGPPRTGSGQSAAAKKRAHRRGKSKAEDVLESLMDEDVTLDERLAVIPSSSREDLFGTDNMSSSDAHLQREQENYPLPLSQIQYGAGAGAFDNEPLLTDGSPSKWTLCWQRFIYILMICFDCIRRSYIVTAALPAFVTGIFLFYHARDYEVDFLPGKAKVYWWFFFVSRQIVTLELACVSQWLLLDCLLLRYRIFVKILGTFIILGASESKGWPSVLSSWGMWDLLLLHGDNKFQHDWFYWTGWEFTSAEQRGTLFLESDVYLRLLVSMLVAGILTAAKRTFIAIYFGERQLAQFKSRFSQLLKDIILMNEIADLAEDVETNSLQFTTPSVTEGNENAGDDQTTSASSTKSAQAKRMSKKGAKRGIAREVSAARFRLDSSDEVLHEIHHEEEDEAGASASVSSPSAPRSRYSEDALLRTQSGSFRIKKFLDSWEEPKAEEVKLKVSLDEVFQFDRALEFMGESHPFGEGFGPAHDRDACIESAHSVYNRLLLLERRSELDCGALKQMLVEGLPEESAERKIKTFSRLFRPNAQNKLSVVDFVQSCDNVYKRLRYFRASVNNASVIDRVLENIMNTIFFFVLWMLLLSLMQFNPWPVLVSITSLLVSVSFALGPSVSKFVEGIMFIAVRRPYDLGDRIVITDGISLNFPGPGDSYFVEDITLWTTTLRFTKTNEVSTVANASLATSRIVNYNRSKHALIYFELQTTIAILKDNKLARFRAELEDYVRQKTSRWSSLSFCRSDYYDADYEKVLFALTFQHRYSWQAAGTILLHRSDLLEFVYQTGLKLGIHFETCPQRMIVYQGGVLDKEHTQDLKKNAVKHRTSASMS